LGCRDRVGQLSAVPSRSLTLAVLLNGKLFSRWG
jgi:hypothetical protein